MPLQIMVSLRRPAVLVLLALLAVSCGGRKLSTDFVRPEPTSALPPAESGPLESFSRELAPRLTPGESGFELIDDSRDALEWRLALVDSAVSSLDMQYYFWLADAGGLLLLDRVLAAADRGVDVRLIVDDMKIKGKRDDRDLEILDSHANVELVVYNPWVKRGGLFAHGANFLGDMRRLNRRMHNKLIVADNRLAIVGGRNIGDHYWGLGEKFNNIDLDVLAAGPIVADLSTAFDYYFSCGLAFPAEAFGFGVTEQELVDARARLRTSLEERRPLLGHFSAQRLDRTSELSALATSMHVGRARLVYDNPGDKPEDRPTQVFDYLDGAADGIERDVLIASAFFVPTDEDVDWVARKNREGVRVRVLTNSLASNPNTISHDGYRRRRKPMLHAGAELYELRPDGAQKPDFETPPITGKWLGLHAKTLVADGRFVFVGSFNADPRSAEINTEMGVLIESEALAGETQAAIERMLAPENSWHVHFDERGDLRWDSQGDVRKKQPARGWFQRFIARVGNWFIPNRWL